MWHLNGEPLPLDPGSGWPLIGGIQYPPSDPARLIEMGAVWVEPEPPALTAEDICRQIDAERDRRTALDFAYDFGATPAVDDSGAQIAAGERLLQMRPEDQRNWQALQGAALTAIVSGAPDTTLPLRAEDNWNIQTTAAQVLQVLAAMTAHASAMLFHGGALKSQVRAADDPASVDWTTGWPGDV
ncbi:hypothetical protein V8F63_09845 [Brevundimonas sp. LF-1]|uniref:DUF4376 domain-containing protein n=1 Tax=Brevundimonas sp. LF-1 TaxID=3126100 RepID=UPI0030E3ACA2